jgi:hypothetical protein
MRLPKSHNAGTGQGHILDMVSIRERPAEAEDRAMPGHWEGDLLSGGNDTHNAFLREAGLCSPCKFLVSSGRITGWCRIAFAVASSPQLPLIG